MSQLQALIFDVDGTLAETERDGHRLAFNRAFADANLDWVWPVGLYGKLLDVAGGKERIAYYLKQYRPQFVPQPDLSTFCKTLHQAKTQHFQQILQAGSIPLRPGVRRLIQEARQQGVRLAIATTSSPDNVLPLLQTTLAADAASWFEVIAAGDIVPAKKPAPDIYLYALDKMALPATQCLVIEDSYQGLTAATQAGLKTVVTVNDYTRKHSLSAATLVLNHLGEPHQPFEVLAGRAQQSYYFTLELAQYLLKQEPVAAS